MLLILFVVIVRDLSDCIFQIQIDRIEIWQDCSLDWIALGESIFLILFLYSFDSKRFGLNSKILWLSQNLSG